MKSIIYCLLIDDDTDDRDFFKLALNSVNPKIIMLYSPSGGDAIKNLTSGIFKPDYIFLDLNMMPMGGIECLKQIKKINHCVDIPVIIYSTSIDENVVYQTLRLGAFNHFEKPSRQVELEEYFKRLFPVK